MNGCYSASVFTSVLLAGLTLAQDKDPTGQVRCFKGHQSIVDCVVVSPDGKLIVSGAWDGTMRIWDVSSGNEIHCVRGYKRGIIGSVDISTDGQRMVSVDADKRVHVHDVTSAKEVQRFNAYSSHADNVVFTADGRHLITSGGDYSRSDVDCRVKLWDLHAAKVLRQFQGHKSFVQCIAVSHDSRFLLTGAGHWAIDRSASPQNGEWAASKPVDCTVRLWDIATGKEVRRFEGHTYMIKSVAFSPDGRYVISGGLDKTIRLWDVSTGKEIRRFEGQTEGVWSVAFSRDGKSIVAGVGTSKDVTPPAFGKFPFGYDPKAKHIDCTVRVWEVATGKQTHCFTGHAGPIMTAKFTPDGDHVVSGSDDGTIRMWKLKQ